MIVVGHPGQTWFAVFVCIPLGAFLCAVALGLVGAVPWAVAAALGAWTGLVVAWAGVKFQPGAQFGPWPEDLPWGEHGSWGVRVR